MLTMSLKIDRRGGSRYLNWLRINNFLELLMPSQGRNQICLILSHAKVSPNVVGMQNSAQLKVLDEGSGTLLMAMCSLKC